jgi:ribosomal protein S18 acetylase RimI-like enzyme
MIGSSPTFRNTFIDLHASSENILVEDFSLAGRVGLRTRRVTDFRAIKRMGRRPDGANAEPMPPTETAQQRTTKRQLPHFSSSGTYPQLLPPRRSPPQSAYPSDRPSETIMKAKDLKILRKKLTKVNKTEYDPLHGMSKDIFSIAPPTPDSEALSVRFASSLDIANKSNKKLFGEILSLFERNMGELYEKSSWGLDTEKKSAELKHANARYLLVETTSSEENQQLAGFVHFRFAYDDEDQPTGSVLYVYEIQIDEKFRRQGLGKKLMGISEQIAANAEVSKVLLTVFKSNQSAMEFYKRLDYGIDVSSPSNHNEPADYEILCKSVV